MLFCYFHEKCYVLQLPDVYVVKHITHAEHVILVRGGRSREILQVHIPLLDPRCTRNHAIQLVL